MYKLIALVLCVILLLNGCELEKFEDIIIAERVNCSQIELEFSIGNNNCFAPCEINFSNTSKNAIDFEWNFGDGNSSLLGNPVHKFQKTR